MSFSDEQKQQLHELLTDVHSSYSTKDELIDMNRKLNEVMYIYPVYYCMCVC